MEKNLLAFRKTEGTEHTPEELRAQVTLLEGDPRDAAAEWLKLAKTLLLDTGMVAPCLYFQTPAGPLMMPMIAEEPAMRDLRAVTRRAANLSRELGATRVLGFGSLWLFDKALLRAPASKRTTKRIQATKVPALLAFCADAETGVAIRTVRVHETAQGRPVGFSDPDPRHAVDGVAKLVTATVGSGFIVDPAERQRVALAFASAFDIANAPALPSPDEFQADLARLAAE